MAEQGSVVVVGGTRASGWRSSSTTPPAARRCVLTGQSQASVDDALSQVGGAERQRAVFDLAQPETIGPALAGVGPVKHLVLAAIDRDANNVREYNIERAIRLVTLKLVGYTEVVHALVDRLSDDSALVLFGGMAKERPYPGSTTVTTVNGGVVGLTRTLVEELRRSASTRSTRASWATARSGPRSRRRSTTTPPRRPPAGWRRWPTSSMPSSSCSRTRPSTAST
jgi:hypothetical protein